MLNKYPVVFFVFKRPATTAQFLGLIKQAGITKIYIFADAPRNPVESVETSAVKAAIKQFQTDNPKIKVIAHYAKSNQGLKQSIISGLNQVFAKESAAIILEDDCLPTPDFFQFTSQMLAKYESDARVMSVNGTSTGGTYQHSYGFTKYPQCWGWATWARAWQLYDPTLSSFNRESWRTLAKRLGFGPLLRAYWYYMLNLVQSGRLRTWDFQWSYAHFRHSGLAISPSLNLIRNIGFDEAATNTKTRTKVADMETYQLTWPLTHPKRVGENLSISSSIEQHFYVSPIAILGLIRQYLYWAWSKYAART